MNFFCLISNKVLLKKRKAPLSTQWVDTWTIKAAHKKKETQQTLKYQNTSNSDPQEALPATVREPCLFYAEWTRLHHRS
jgi:hypothetical protein